MQNAIPLAKKVFAKAGLLEVIERLLTEYKETYGSAIGIGLMKYKFDDFKETDDSLTFYGVTRIFGSKELHAAATFSKGNIRVEDSSNGSISYMAINK